MRRIALISFVLLVGVAIALGDLTPAPVHSQVTAPTVTGVSPNSGPVSGGTTVTVSGSGFSPGCSVSFGGATAAVQATPPITASQITVVSPVSPLPSPGTGPVNVIVTCNGVSSMATSADLFTYTTGTVGGGGVASFSGITFFVSPSGNDANNCLSPATACATIQAAVDLTRDRDIVVVFPGTYDVPTPIEVPDLIAVETAPVGATSASTTTFSVGTTGASTTCTTGGSSKVILRSANGQPIFHVTGVGSPTIFPVVQGFIVGGATSFDNPGAIQLDETSYAQVNCNIIGQEDLPNVIGILLRNADNVLIQNNTIHGSTQFPISPVLGPTPPVGGFGIVTSECLGSGRSNDAFVINNLLTYNSNAGVFFCSDGTGGHVIASNTVRSNGRGIVLRDANDVAVAANAIQQNYYDGVEVLGTSADNTITSNTIESQDGPNANGVLLQGDGLLFPLDNVIVGNSFRRNNTNITIVGARRTLIGVDKTFRSTLEGSGPAQQQSVSGPGNIMSADGERTDIVFRLGNPSGMSLNSASPSFGQPSDTIVRNNSIISNGPCNATRGCAIRLTAGVTVNIDATSNDWGVTQNDEIRAELWDKFHDPALGQVLVAVPGLPILGTPPAVPTPFPNAVPPISFTPVPFNQTPVSGANFPAALAAPQAANAPPPPTAYIDPTSGNYYVQMTVCVTNSSNQPVPNDQLMVGLSDATGDQLRSAMVSTGANGCFSGAVTAGTDVPPATVSLTDPSGAVTNLGVTGGSPPYRTPAGPVVGG